jgi:prolyl 4-hydroxylase
VSDEIQRILEWWTGGQPLIPTATFGIRIYHSGSMLINHVDRADTHLASAVIQVAQEGMGTGWPLEIMHPDDGTVAEVYLQPGELVLYEGARFLHGRPMRLNGTSFANIFSHFKPVDWYGPGKSPKYDGFLDEWGYLLPLEKINGGDGGEELVMKSDEL